MPSAAAGPVSEAIPAKTGRCIAESDQPAPVHLADQERAPHITKSLALVPRNNATAHPRANQTKASEASNPSIARLVQRTLYTNAAMKPTGALANTREVLARDRATWLLRSHATKGDLPTSPPC